MNTVKGNKLNQLLQATPNGVVLLASWMNANGYSADLQRVYRNSNWLESIGTGAMIRKGDQVSYEGGLYALQSQAGMSIHPGGKTALSLMGKAHFLDLGSTKVSLFGGQGEKLPAWFKNHDWGVDLHYHATEFLLPTVGLTDLEMGSFSIKVSNPARALMECLYRVPLNESLTECYEIMEGLSTLRPLTTQTVLDSSKSVKANRLFLYLAEKADHAWFKHIKTEKIQLGSGKRSIIRGGAYNAKYQITVNKELEAKNE